MSVNNIKVLVTGATGFLGSNIIKAFNKQKHVTVIAACRDKTKLPGNFRGEIRQGDLRDPLYLNSIVQGIDVICHAGTWSSMWGHHLKEKENFYRPTLNLIDKAINAGCSRFLMTSTVAINRPRRDGEALDDFAESNYSRFWPHLDYLIDVDHYMQANAHRGMQLVNMRLGHFIGTGNTLGIVPALVPRLKSWMVPWLAGGKSRLPLITDSDLANGFVLAAQAEGLQNYESFNICGNTFPSTREVIEYIANKTGVPKPIYSVPYPAGYAFGWLMEKLFPLLPGKGPFLTRSIVHLSEEWICSTSYAKQKLGFNPQKNWQTAMDEALAELKDKDYPWQYLAQS